MAADRNRSNFNEEIIILSSSDEEESRPDTQINLGKVSTSCAQQLNQDNISSKDDTSSKILCSNSCLKDEERILYSRITWEDLPDSFGSQPNDDKSPKKDVAPSSNISRSHIMGNSCDNKTEFAGAELSDKSFKNNVTDNKITQSTSLSSLGLTHSYLVDIKDESEAAMLSFLTVCRAFIDDEDGRKIIESAKKFYYSANTDFVHTKQFCDFMNKKSKNVLKDSQNMFLHIKEVIDELRVYRRKKQRFLGKVVTKSVSSTHDLVCNGTNVSPISENCVNNMSANGTASHHLTGLETAASSSTSSKRHPTEKQIKRLECLLQKLDKKIKHLQRKEVSLDSLDDNDSAYIKEDLFKKRFIKVWNKLCSLTGRSNETGRETEKKFRFNGSRYSEVNEKISKFVNKKKIFPDYSDVLSVISSVNTTMKLPDMQVHMLARETFEEVGKALQMRRYKDNRELFGCFLTDNIDFCDDPAERDTDLKSALQESSKKASKDLDEIIDKYVQKQIELKLEPEDVQDNDKSEHSSEEQDENESERSDVDFIEATVNSNNENDVETTKEEETEHNRDENDVETTKEEETEHNRDENDVETAKEEETEHNRDENDIGIAKESEETEHKRVYHLTDKKPLMSSTYSGILDNCREENSTSSSNSSAVHTSSPLNLPSTSSCAPLLLNSLKRHQQNDLTIFQPKTLCLENNNFLDTYRNFIETKPVQPQIDDDVIIVE